MKCLIFVSRCHDEVLQMLSPLSELIPILVCVNAYMQGLKHQDVYRK